MKQTSAAIPSSIMEIEHTYWNDRKSPTQKAPNNFWMLDHHLHVKFTKAHAVKPSANIDKHKTRSVKRLRRPRYRQSCDRSRAVNLRLIKIWINLFSPSSVWDRFIRLVLQSISLLLSRRPISSLSCPLSRPINANKTFIGRTPWSQTVSADPGRGCHTVPAPREFAFLCINVCEMYLLVKNKYIK